MTDAKPKTMLLPVPLLPDEVALRAQELAQAEAALKDGEDRLEEFVEAAKLSKKEIEADITGARLKVHELAVIVREKREKREVRVEEVADFPRGAMDVVRRDTGEVVASRALTSEERQRSLFSDKSATA